MERSLGQRRVFVPMRRVQRGRNDADGISSVQLDGSAWATRLAPFDYPARSTGGQRTHRSRDGQGTVVSMFDIMSTV